MGEPLSRYDVTVTVACDGGSRPGLAAFAAAAGRAAWRRSASVLSAHLAGRIISVVTVTAPGRYAAVAVARAVVCDALNRQGPVIGPLGRRPYRAFVKGPRPDRKLPSAYRLFVMRVPPGAAGDRGSRLPLFLFPARRVRVRYNVRVAGARFTGVDLAGRKGSADLVGNETGVAVVDGDGQILDAGWIRVRCAIRRRARGPRRPPRV